MKRATGETVAGSGWWQAIGLASRSVPVFGARMNYFSGGPPQAPVLLFLHGNPTSSFLWRHVIDDLSADFRCLAVDLIGMGRSEQPDLDYGFSDQARFVEGFVDTLGLRSVTVIGHDWGAVLGLDLLGRRADVVARIAVCEGHLHSFADWEEMDAGSRDLFRRIREPGTGEQLVLSENIFLEQVLPAGMNHRLSPSEWETYRLPFRTPERRRPILRWAQQIPVDGDPPDVTRVIARNQRTLLHGGVPRLLLHGEPGAVVGAAEVAWVAQQGDGIDIVGVGAGSHFLPEDQPSAITGALRSWLA